MRVFLCFLFSPLFVFSQQNNFVSYSVAEGLSQTTVFAILQDMRGYLWVGTSGGGLSRFDGTAFKTFNTKNGLSGNSVRCLLEDHKGNLWIGTNEGISIYNGKNFKTINKSNGLSGTTVLKIYEDSRQIIWAGTDDGGLNKITVLPDGSISVKSYSEKNVLKTDFIFDIHEDRYKRLWLATWRGIAVLTFEKDTFSIRNLFYEIPSDEIICIEEDGKGNLWFGTSDAGAFKIYLTGSDSGKITIFNAENGLGDNTVWSIHADNKENVWFGTNQHGVVRMEPTGFHYYTEQNGLPSSQILKIFEDSEENIWIGTNGNGLCRFLGDNFVHYTKNEGLGNNQILSVLQDKNGSYWFGTNGNGVTNFQFENGKNITKTYTINDGLADNVVYSIAQGKDGNLWFGTKGGASLFDGKKFKNYTEADSLIFNSVNTVLVDKNEHVWFGTSDGISKFDGKGFLHLRKEKGPNDPPATISGRKGLGNNEIQMLLEDKRGNVWIATSDGLSKYDNGKLTSYDEMEGLMYKNIYALAEDYLGNIWLGTNGGGLYKLNIGDKKKKNIQFVANDSLLGSNIIYSLIFQDKNTLLIATIKGFAKVTLDGNQNIISVRNYNRSDGFTGTECNQNAVLKDNKGTIWFGTSKGVTCYNPALENNSKILPRTYISGIKLFFENIDWSNHTDTISAWFNLPENLILPYDKNHLTFQFSGISFNNPEKVHYKYRLEGRETQWSPLQKETFVTYSGLEHGSYVFQVIAINAKGITSRAASFSFKINPPWYKTIWFYIGCIVVLLSFFYLYVKIRERKLLEEKKILEKKVTERTKEVVHQKEIIEEKNRDIMSSIRYAKRIQDAILPPDELIKKCLQNAFILFKPRDIVSGDFYFADYIDNRALFAVVDCTGHGVPGAFVSIVGYNGLSRAIKEFKLTEPAQILDKLNEIVEETFRQHDKTDIRDGMDIALCCAELIEKQNDGKPCIKFQYAGANNSMYILRKKEIPLNGYKPTTEGDEFNLYEIKADKQPIGAYDDRKNFTNHTFELMEGDAVYVFSDGYADQFGGPKGKKFKYSQFEKLLLSLQNENMEKQRERLNTSIEEWKGELEQVDDICIFGVKI